MLENFANHALAVKPICGIQEVGILPQAIIKILSAKPRDDDFGVLLVHPCGNRIGRRAHNDANSRSVQLLYDAVHPGKLELAALWLPQPPTRFANANNT